MRKQECLRKRQSLHPTPQFSADANARAIGTPTNTNRLHRYHIFCFVFWKYQKKDNKLFIFAGTVEFRDSCKSKSTKFMFIDGVCVRRRA
jgi:hypothetical protein